MQVKPKRIITAVHNGNSQCNTVMVGIKLPQIARNELQCYINELDISLECLTRRLILNELRDRVSAKAAGRQG
jgi:hypothetical protein